MKGPFRFRVQMSSLKPRPKVSTGALVMIALLWSAGCRPGPKSGVCPAPLYAPASRGSGAAGAKPLALAGAVLIRGARVWTAAASGVLDSADVLVVRGRILQIGRDLQAPAGVLVVQGKGLDLTPGLIDPHSHIGVYSLPGLVGHADGNEWARPVTAAVRAADAYWPQDPAIPRALAAGVTTAQILAGSANLIGGRSVVVRMIPGRTVDEVRFPGSTEGIKMACGENPKRAYGAKGGPYSRMGSAAWLRRAFAEAQEYRRKWKVHRAKLAHWRIKRKRACDEHKPHEHAVAPAAPERDPQLEILVRILDGQLRVHWHCYRASDMAAMLRIAETHTFRIAAFHHATEAYKIRDLLARHGAGAVTWINWWGFKVEAIDAIPENVALLHQAGVNATLHSDSPHVIQRLNQEGALAYFRGVQAGLTLEQHDAVKFVTINAARLLGIQGQTGSIEQGKLGDLVLWDRSPLSVYARPAKVFVAGKLMFDRDRGLRPTDFGLRVPARPRAPAAPPVQPPPQSQKQTAANTTRADLAVVNAIPFGGGAPVTVLIRGDRVVALGAGIAAPAGARVIDGSGLVLTPGLIASETRLGLNEISMESAANDRVRKGGAVRAALDVAEAINPRSWAVPVSRIEGITTAVVSPGGGLVSGRSAAFDLYGQSPSQIHRRSPLALHVNLGLAGARSMKGSRARALMRLRELLDDARVLLGARRAVEARRVRRLSASVTQLSALGPVLRREIPLVVAVNRASDILATLELARAQKLRLVISGGAEGWRVAGQLAHAGVPVLVNADLNAPVSFDTLDARYDNAALLAARGVTVALSAVGDAHNIRSLRQQAGILVAWGLPRSVALEALTHNPARIFGLKDLGSLAPGKRANLVLWDGDPFELKTRARQVIIGGKVVPLVSRQTLLRDRYLKLPLPTYR